VGAGFALIGCAANAWTLERFVLYDGQIESTLLRASITAINIALVCAGGWLFLRAPQLDRPPLGNWIMLALSTGLALAVCEVAYRLVQEFDAPEALYYPGEFRSRESPNFVADAVLGWRMRASRTFWWTTGGVKINYTANREGFRSPHEFTSPQSPVVALAGDSFTWGTGVEYRDTFAARLDANWPHLEIHNYGQPGFGVDQMWQTVRSLILPRKPAFLVVSFIDDDLPRSLTAYRTEEGMNKPRFRLDSDGELVALSAQDHPGVLRDLANRSELWRSVAFSLRRMRPWGELWVLNLALFEAIAADCARADVPLLFVRVAAPGQQGFAVLQNAFAERQLALFDFGEGLGSAAEHLYIPLDSHLNPEGHARLASQLVDEIQARVPRLVGPRG
jgi:hypothetical protein